MKVTFFGTTTLLFDDGIDQILFDCHFTRPSLIQLGFKKIQTDTKLIDSILLDHPMNRLKAIFVSHSHHDHVMDVPYVANQYNCDVYGSMSALNVARGGNVKEKKLHEFECFKEAIIGDYHIMVIPSLHSKAKWYNDDLGQTIDSPLVQPAKKKEYKEGGSFDFIIKHLQKTYVIRPSFNYIEGQLNGIKADVLFLGVGGLSKATPSELSTFFKETIDKVEAKIVIPIHWDNFFSRLDKPIKGMPVLFENTNKSLYEVVKYCQKSDISYILLLPLTFIDLN